MIKKGDLFLITSALIEGLNPILINAGTKTFPPILFAGIATLVSSLLFFIWVIKNRLLSQLFDRRALINILGVTVCIIILPSFFFYTGSSLTSGINTTILMQMEIFFMLIIFGFIFRERMSIWKILSALLIGFGAVIILFPSKFSSNIGDILIVIGTIFLPFGNYFAKKALRQVDTSVLLFVRSFIGGLVLLLISVLIERNPNIESLISGEYWYIIVLQILLVMTLGKIFWYEGLKRVDVPRAISIVMSYPAFSFVYAILFLKEIPNVYQLLGFFIIMMGLLSIHFQPNQYHK